MQRFIHSVYSKFGDVFTCDLRSLALLRVGVGLVVLLDLVIRAQDLTAHYTDAGIFPRSLVLHFSSNAAVSFHLANGSWLFMASLFAIQAFVAVLLIVGFRTRLVSFVLWVMVVSLQARSPAVLFGGDRLLAAMLLWGIFLPWGAYFSIDSSRTIGVPLIKKTVYSLATVAYVTQIVLMYTLSVLHKFGAAWVRDGTAIFFALSKDDFATPVGQFLVQFPPVTRFLTYSVYIMELLIPVLLLFPFFTKQTRILAVVIVLMLHTGIGFSLDLAIFPFISVVSTLGLLPSLFWDSAGSRLPKAQPIKLFYDDKCSFCLRVVGLIQTFLVPRNVAYVPASKDRVMWDQMHEQNSWVVVRDTRHKSWRFDAFTMVLRSSSTLFLLYPLMAFGPIKAVGNKVYVLLSRKLHKTCSLSASKGVAPVSVHLSKKLSIVVLCLFIYVIYQNIASLKRLHIPLPQSAITVGTTLGINQNWALFNRFGGQTGWYVFEGTLATGSTVDIVRNALATDSKPGLSVLHPNARWQKVMENSVSRGDDLQKETFQLSMLSYYCRYWNSHHEPAERVRQVNLLFYGRYTRSDFSSTMAKKQLLRSHTCYIT